MAAEDEQLVIILHLEEGIGFNKGCEKVFCQASINGHKLDHEPVKAGHTTSFSCNLIWETTRSSVKGMKVENIPLKIDLYGMKSNAYTEQVGYILVPMRSVPVMPLSKALQGKSRWHKLIGLSSEWRAHRPEILMNVLITDSSYLKFERVNLQTGKGVSQERLAECPSDSIVLDENPNPCMMTSQKGLFIRVLQADGLLQVGNIDVDSDIFNVKILIKSIRNLSGILEKLKVSNNADPELFINYILLGNNHSRKLDKKFNRLFKIQEKISINFRTSLKSLHQYFEEVFYIPIELYLDNRMLGTLELRLNNLINVFDLNEFLTKYPKSFDYERKVDLHCNNTLIDENESKPFLDYSVSIQYQVSRPLHQINLVNKTNVPFDAQAAGDTISMTRECEASKMFGIKAMPSSLPGDSNEMVTIYEENSNASHQVEQPVPEIKSLPEKADEREIPHLYCYTINIHSIRFNKKPGRGVWQFSFYHERADTARAYVNREVSEKDIVNDHEITLNELMLKLYFTSHKNEVEDAITALPHVCTLCIKGPYGLHVKANLDCNNLLFVSKENSRGNILLSNQSDSTTAFAEVSVALCDEGFNFNSKLHERECKNYEVSTVNSKEMLEEHNKMLFDEEIAYGMIKELEEWKKFEHEKFLQQMKQLEQEHLQKLKTDCEKKKMSCEEQIAEKKKMLDEVGESLEKARRSFESREIQAINAERELHRKIKHELEKAYQEKINLINVQSTHLKEDFEQRLIRKDIQIDELQTSNSQLQAKVRELQHENFHLTDSLNSTKVECEELRRTHVPKCELEKLMSELELLKIKFEEVQQSKLFYKEQWAKIFRENHRYRRENSNFMRDNIFATKYDGFQECLSDECSLMSFDKEELEEIKRQLNV